MAESSNDSSNDEYNDTIDEISEGSVDSSDDVVHPEQLRSGPQNETDTQHNHHHHTSVYELLGAPILLFRPFRVREDEPYLDESDYPTSLRQRYMERNRIYARWYHPVDYKERFLDHGRHWHHYVKRWSVNPALYTGKNKDIFKFTEDPYVNNETNLAHTDMFLSALPDLHESITNSRKKPDLEAIFGFAVSDVPYAKPFKDTDKIQQGAVGRIKYYTIQRLNCGDPAYLPPVDLDSWKEMAQGEADSKKRKARNLEASQDETNGPLYNGNSILVCKCPCSTCEGQLDPNLCVVHPIGPLLDKLRVTPLQLPLGRRVVDIARTGDFDFEAGDTILQVVQAGRFLAVRTALYVSLAAFTFKKVTVDESLTNVCYGLSIRLLKKQRIDLRTMYLSLPSYFPKYTCCHPRFGGMLSKSNLAILSHSNRQEYNVIHHVMVGDESMDCTKHEINNLQFITHIEHSTHHPMVLWSVARSFVRPTPLVDNFQWFPRLGHGTSLYSIDLRTNKGTFQWSPSHAMYQAEGTQSLSGLHVDWERDNVIYVTSSSAGKTWELDARQPVSVVNEWSLPHTCESPASINPQFNFHGPGMILQQPLSINLPKTTRPLLAINKDIGAYGLHLYQGPDRRPLFGSKSLECTPNSSLHLVNEYASVAYSSVFAFPLDQSSNTFMCGLSAFQVPADLFISAATAKAMDYKENEASSVVCAVVGGNKGELMAYPLLGNSHSRTMSRIQDGFPIGTTCIKLPDELERVYYGGGQSLRLQLTNKMFACRDAVIPQIIRSKTFSKLQRKTRRGKLESDTKIIKESFQPVMFEEVEGQSSTVDATSAPLAYLYTGDDCKEKVQVETKFVDRAQHEYSSTLNCFSGDVAKFPPTGRSDITLDLLNAVKYDWKSSESENDDDDRSSKSNSSRMSRDSAF